MARRIREASGSLLRVTVLATVLVALIGLSIGALTDLHAQAIGATLTVLRGTTAVQRADRTPLSPATSGLLLNIGDQVATLANASALVTFFDGSEVELGADTTII